MAAMRVTDANLLARLQQVVSPYAHGGRWRWVVHAAWVVPEGILVTMKPDAHGVPDEQLPLIGNTPYLVMRDWSVRSTWPYEFERYFPDSMWSTLEVEDDGRTVEQLEGEHRAGIMRRGVLEPGPGPFIRIVPRGAPMGPGSFMRAVSSVAGGIG